MTDEVEETKEVSPPSNLIVRMKVTRKDGTVEDRGVVSEGWVSFEASNGDPS